MIIVFWGEGFFVALVILAALCFLGILGSVHAMLSFMLEHWYLIFLMMCVKTVIDGWFYLLISKHTITKANYEVQKLEQYKRKMYLISFIRNLLIFVSALLFCKFEINIMERHPFISVVYAIVYIFGMFFAFISTYITGMSILEGFLSKKYFYKLKSWEKFSLHYATIVVWSVVCVVMVMPYSFFSLLILSIASCSSFVLSCNSAME